MVITKNTEVLSRWWPFTPQTRIQPPSGGEKNNFHFSHASSHQKITLFYNIYLPTSFSSAKMTRCGHIYCWTCMLHYQSLVSSTMIALCFALGEVLYIEVWLHMCCLSKFTLFFWHIWSGAANMSDECTMKQKGKKHTCEKQNILTWWWSHNGKRLPPYLYNNILIIFYLKFNL